MGSMLYESVGTQRCFDELNSTEPEAVFRVHQAYIEAGAQIIETNTFGANRFKLEPLGLAEEVQRLNSRGVKIARDRKSTRLNSSHGYISYAVFCLKKKKQTQQRNSHPHSASD